MNVWMNEKWMKFDCFLSWVKNEFKYRQQQQINFNKLN